MDANWCCIDCIFLSKMTTFDLHDVTWFVPILQAVASLPFLLCGICGFYILRACMGGFHPTPRSILQKKWTCLLTSPELYYIIYNADILHIDQIFSFSDPSVIYTFRNRKFHFVLPQILWTRKILSSLFYCCITTVEVKSF